VLFLVRTLEAPPRSGRRIHRHSRLLPRRPRSRCDRTHQYRSLCNYVRFGPPYGRRQRPAPCPRSAKREHRYPRTAIDR
jgi:hypothetical protein